MFPGLARQQLNNHEQVIDLFIAFSSSINPEKCNVKTKNLSLTHPADKLQACSASPNAKYLAFQHPVNII